jgi:hypothetical protein
MRLPLLLVLCSAFAVLPLSVGCGGGDDPTPDAGPLPPPPVPDAGTPDAGTPDAGTKTDLIAPTVVSTLPAAGTPSVPPESRIEITFSERMSITRGTMQVTPGSSLPNGGMVTVRAEDWDAAHTKVAIGFTQGLPLRTQVTVNVANFADEAGNPLPPFSFNFTVGDGLPPRVTAATPTEGASRVPLNTARVSFTFNEPMDTTVGSLIPSGGLILGASSWTGTQMISAPITGGLANDGNYSVRLSNFRNASRTALDPTIFLGDGKLDFGTGPDVTKPTVVEASPAEGATGVLPEDTSLIVFTFSEPMDKTVGTAELVDTGGRTVLTPSWAPDGFSVSYNVRLRLRHSSSTRVLLANFKDLVGNLIDPVPYLGNGELNFATGADTLKPYLESANPQEGQEIYPSEVYATGTTPPTGVRKVITLRFNEPMDTTIKRVTLYETYVPTASRGVDGQWSADAVTMTVTIFSTSTGQPPLQSEYFYTLDLTGLKDRNGNSLDAVHPSLGDGKLDFKTLRDSPVLNHACEHALVVSPTSVAATGTGASGPRADTLHARYAVSLPSNGTSFSGFVRMELAPETWHTLYLDRNTSVQVINAVTNGIIQVNQVAEAPACAQVTHSATFYMPLDPTVHVRFGPSLDSTLRFIPERTYQ